MLWVQVYSRYGAPVAELGLYTEAQLEQAECLKWIETGRLFWKRRDGKFYEREMPPNI